MTEPVRLSSRRSAAPRFVLAGMVLAVAMAATPAVELCDGRDEDRDGTLDPDCPRVCADPRPDGDERLLSASDARASLGRDRSLAWDGRRYAAVWIDEDGFDTLVRLARTDPSGRALHEPVTLSDPAPIDADPAVAAGGDGYGVVWSQEDFGLPRILFAHVDSDGTVDAGPVVVGDEDDDGQRPAIAWDGEAFTVAWAWYNSRVYVQRIAPTGAPLAPPSCLNCDDTSGAGDVSIAVGPAGLAVAYDDAAGAVKLARTDAGGAPLGPPVTVAAGTARRPSVVRSDGEWAVAWYDRRNTQDGIYLNRVDDAGALVGPEVEVDGDEAYSWDPSLAWTGAELLVGWAGADGAFHGLFLRRLDPTGQPLAPTLRLPGGDLPYPRCSLAWNGSRPALLRDTDEIGSPRPVWLRLVDCCPDRDGDGVPTCDGDCDDTDARISPGLEESCDGRDDDCDGILDEGCETVCAAAPFEELAELGAQPAPGVGLAVRGGDPAACVVRQEPAGGTGSHVWLERGGPPWQGDPLEQDDAASTVPAAARAGDRCAAVWRDERGETSGLRYGARSAPDGSPVRLDVDLGVGPDPTAPSLARTGAGLALGFAGGEDPRASWTRLTLEGARLHATEPLGPADPAASGRGSVAVAPRLDGPGSVVAHLDPEGDGAAVRLELRDRHGGTEAGPALVAPATPGREDVAVTATGSGYLVAWSERPAAGSPREIHLRPFGPELAPLEPVQQLTGAGGPADAPALTFTGGEVVVVFRDGRDGQPRPLRARVTARGERLGPDTPLGTDRDVGPPRAAWSGGALWTAWTHGPSRAVRPGRVECAAVPEAGLVRGLRWIDEATLAWDPVESAVYDVVTGALDVLASSGDYASAVDACEASDLDATELTPADRPLPRFYLVRAVVGGSPGSYDADGLISTPGRDPGIAGSPQACP